MKTLAMLATLTFVLGCATTPMPADAPRYAGRIKVAIYDPTPRQPTTSFQVFDSGAAVGRPYRIIALLSHESNPDDSALMLNAIAYRARLLGADGMITLPVQDTGYKWDNLGIKKQQPIYSANAIVFETPSKATANP